MLFLIIFGNSDSSTTGFKIEKVMLTLIPCILSIQGQELCRDGGISKPRTGI